MATLIGFHRVLIACAIAFCLGYGLWELRSWWGGGSSASLLMGLLFAILAAGLGYYLAHLRSFVGYEDEPRDIE